MGFGNGVSTGERGGQTTLDARLAQERKDVVSALAQHFVATSTGNALHCVIPCNDPAVAIERKEAVDASVEQALQQRWGFVLQTVRVGGFRFGIYFAPVSNINPVASRTRIFEPNNTGMDQVADSATS